MILPRRTASLCMEKNGVKCLIPTVPEFNEFLRPGTPVEHAQLISDTFFQRGSMCNDDFWMMVR